MASTSDIILSTSPAINRAFNMYSTGRQLAEQEKTNELNRQEIADRINQRKIESKRRADLAAQFEDPLMQAAIFDSQAGFALRGLMEAQNRGKQGGVDLSQIMGGQGNVQDKINSLINAGMLEEADMLSKIQDRTPLSKVMPAQENAQMELPQQVVAPTIDSQNQEPSIAELYAQSPMGVTGVAPAIGRTLANTIGQLPFARGLAEEGTPIEKASDLQERLVKFGKRLSDTIRRSNYPKELEEIERAYNLKSAISRSNVDFETTARVIQEDLENQIENEVSKLNDPMATDKEKATAKRTIQETLNLLREFGDFKAATLDQQGASDEVISYEEFMRE